jgi:hypothetical protein
MISSTFGGSAGYRTPLLRGGRPAWNAGIVAGDRRRPARSSSSSDMTPPRARRRARASRNHRASASVPEQRREQIYPRCPVCLDALAKVGVARRLSALPIEREAQVRGRRPTVADRFSCLGTARRPSSGVPVSCASSKPDVTDSTTDSPACKRGRSSFPRGTRCTAVLGSVGTGRRRRSGVEHRSLRLRAMVAIAAGTAPE